MHTQIIPIKGMHCRSCEILVEDELMKLKGVKKAVVNEKKGVAHLYCDRDISRGLIEQAVAGAGYQIGVQEKKPLLSRNVKDYTELGLAFLMLALIYMIGTEMGIFNFALNTGGNYGSLAVVFLVGLTAGVSTCMALVGGLVFAASARFAEKHPTASSFAKFKPHLFFNAGRIIAFFAFGAVIGYAGSFFQLSTTALGILTIAVGAVMVIVGLQLTEIFPRLSDFRFVLPKALAKVFGIKKHTEKEYSHRNSFLMGGLTFFLPCGFTQAMQLFAIASGSALVGALTMGVFALGTTPGLLGVGGLTSVVRGGFAKPFFKFAGLVVIALAVFNMSNGFNLSGFNVNAFVSKNAFAQASVDPNVTVEDGVQVVKMIQDGSGYSPNSFTIKKDMPVRWIITSQNPFTCAASIVSAKLGIRRNLSEGENIIEFTPTEVGSISFSCSMGMFGGAFNVVDTDGKTSAVPSVEAANSVQVAAENPGGSCGGGGCGCGGGAARQKTLTNKPKTVVPAAQEGSVQRIKGLYSVLEDIVPNRFSVKSGVPVRFEIEARDNGSGCMGSVAIPGLSPDISVFERGKTTVFEFIPEKPGAYSITCAMGVPRGTITVI